MTAYTYDKAGNKSSSTISNDVCGSHNKSKNSQKSAATCTADEVRYYRCSRCYATNGTYTGSSKLGHESSYYYCSKASYSSTKCIRCSSTKSVKQHTGVPCNYCKQNLATQRLNGSTTVTW